LQFVKGVGDEIMHSFDADGEGFSDGSENFPSRSLRSEKVSGEAAARLAVKKLICEI
jgi:hypothetical protein